eukprot:CAMPEP_0196661888 /NCGR_PEP_ID=MMETSP1086-20130531/46290_1 /TAXON_ID=77921 /ORGANISM="Cyanoptyche  gloeocystis , Strain SAG4.97" /LENGTH=130 /DNA_ID=CAMNT_0041997001 /DNA_START=174 /DNA_END=566 /DNA_ORIENTATION=+
MTSPRPCPASTSSAYTGRKRKEFWDRSPSSIFQKLQITRSSPDQDSHNAAIPELDKDDIDHKDAELQLLKVQDTPSLDRFCNIDPVARALEQMANNPDPDPEVGVVLKFAAVGTSLFARRVSTIRARSSV